MRHFIESAAHRKIRCLTARLVILTVSFGGALVLRADTISSNLSSVTAGTEAATGSTWLTASFGTTTSSATLSSVTLLLSNSVAGLAEVDVYTNSLLGPGALVAAMTSPSSYSSSLSDVTFSTSGITLSANSTYWVVLKALTGEFDWAWTTDNTGTGSGFQGAWGSSSDAGATWYTYSVYPTQLSVTTSATVTATPEPGSALLSTGGLFVGASVFFLHRKRRNVTMT